MLLLFWRLISSIPLPLHHVEFLEELAPGISKVIVEDASLAAFFFAEESKGPYSPEEVVEEATVENLLSEKIVMFADVSIISFEVLFDFLRHEVFVIVRKVLFNHVILFHIRH